MRRSIVPINFEMYSYCLPTLWKQSGQVVVGSGVRRNKIERFVYLSAPQCWEPERMEKRTKNIPAVSRFDILEYPFPQP